MGWGGCVAWSAVLGDECGMVALRASSGKAWGLLSATVWKGRDKVRTPGFND